MAQPAKLRAFPARFSMPLKSDLLFLFILNPEPPPQAFTAGGRLPPKLVNAATALILICLLSSKACVLIAGMVIELPQALPWLAKLAMMPPNMTACDVAAGPEVPIEPGGMMISDVPAAEVVALPPPDVPGVTDADVTVALDPGEAFEMVLRDVDKAEAEPDLLDKLELGSVPHIGRDSLALLAPRDPEDFELLETESLEPLEGGMQMSDTEDPRLAVDADPLGPPDGGETLEAEALRPLDGGVLFEAEPLRPLDGGGALEAALLDIVVRDVGLIIVDATEPSETDRLEPLGRDEEAPELVLCAVLEPSEGTDPTEVAELELELADPLRRDIALFVPEPLDTLLEERELSNPEDAAVMIEAETLCVLEGDKEPLSTDDEDRDEYELLEPLAPLELPEDEVN